jgi:MFS family permease
MTATAEPRNPSSLSERLFRRPPDPAPADPRTTRARLVLCAVALGLAPVLLTLAAFIEVSTSDNAARAAVQIEAHRDRFLAGNLLFALGAAALIPGALALASLVRGRGAAWMTTGACMVALGGGSLALALWSFTIVGYIGTEPGVSRIGFVSLLDHGDNSALIGSAWILGVGALLGMIVAAVGLLRARAVPRWQPMLLIVGPFLTFFGGTGVVDGILSLVLDVALIALAAEAIRAARSPGRTDMIDLTEAQAATAGTAEMPMPRETTEQSRIGGRAGS